MSGNEPDTVGPQWVHSVDIRYERGLPIISLCMDDMSTVRHEFSPNDRLVIRSAYKSLTHMIDVLFELEVIDYMSVSDEWMFLLKSLFRKYEWKENILKKIDGLSTFMIWVEGLI